MFDPEGLLHSGARDPPASFSGESTRERLTLEMIGISDVAAAEKRVDRRRLNDQNGTMSGSSGNPLAPAAQGGQFVAAAVESGTA